MLYKNLNLKFKTIVKASKRCFKTMSVEEYFQNYSKSSRKLDMQSSKLHPLVNASNLFNNQDHDPHHTQCYLYGIPPHKIEKEIPIIFDKTVRYKPDLIFLQMEPMPYISRQRFLSHKCSLNEVEGYDIKGADDLSHPKLLSWEEGVVDPVKFRLN